MAKIWPCFNSLQTGKPIQRHGIRRGQSVRQHPVSIPFKRESLSKVLKEARTEAVAFVSIPFKRESLSKVAENFATLSNLYGVSIPFKRESLSKVTKDGGTYYRPYDWVSIPFKRESLSKAPEEMGYPNDQIKFQFPSNGKAYPKKIKTLEAKEQIRFQFPSNGKAYPKKAWALLRMSELWFQFPSNGKAYPKCTRGHRWEHLQGFNSLQTGKPIQRLPASVLKMISSSFNSLQTGKPIQSQRFNAIVLSDIKRFNSLQTGKPIQSWWHSCKLTAWKAQVSIPFKRESLSKGITDSGEVEYLAGFQFPSNGKAYPKAVSAVRWLWIRLQSVSIPFKRESLSKDRMIVISSNKGDTVSIPFKRESLSKGKREQLLADTATYRRVSIPCKRESLSKAMLLWVIKLLIF